MRSTRKTPAKERNEAAYDDMRVSVGSAWKSDFQQKLARARSYLPSTKPRTEEDRRAIQVFIRHLEKWLSHRPAGRRVRWMKDEDGIEQSGVMDSSQFQGARMIAAERTAADLVRDMNRRWCKENGCRRLTKPHVWDTHLREAIRRVASQLGIAPKQIRADEVRRRAGKK
jgi:hypothetical protein